MKLHDSGHDLGLKVQVADSDSLVDDHDTGRDISIFSGSHSSNDFDRLDVIGTDASKIHASISLGEG